MSGFEEVRIGDVRLFHGDMRDVLPSLDERGIGDGATQ